MEANKEMETKGVQQGATAKANDGDNIISQKSEEINGKMDNSDLINGNINHKKLNNANTVNRRSDEPTELSFEKS